MVDMAAGDPPGAESVKNMEYSFFGSIVFDILLILYLNNLHCY